MPFYTAKDALLRCKRASFRRQKGVDGKTEGKEFDKEGRDSEGRRPQNTASPSPSRGRGCAWRDTCFLMRGKGFVAVWVVEGVKVVRINGFPIRKRMVLRCELFAKRTAYGRVYVSGYVL